MIKCHIYDVRHYNFDRYIIKDNVILEAKVLLIAKSYSIQQVSDKLNFPNPSFFCKYFKAATGTTPRKYQLRGDKVSEDAKDSTL